MWLSGGYPANVIGAKKETSGDMPPKRTSSMRPDVAKRELEQIVRSSSLTPAEKTAKNYALGGNNLVVV